MKAKKVIIVVPLVEEPLQRRIRKEKETIHALMGRLARYSMV